MPSERELRRRVRSVKNIQQVTRAMQLVAASRMRRAQAQVLASRPYEDRLRRVLHDLAPYADPEHSPLLVRRAVRRVGMVLITSDRGLVGALNVNVIRTAVRFAQERPDAAFIAVGRKGVSAVRRLRLPLAAEFAGLGDRPTTLETGPVSLVAQQEFLAERFDEVHLVFPQFINTLRQVPTVRRILPFRPQQDESAAGPRGAQPAGRLQYLFEPDPETVLNAVLPRLIEVSVYQAILEAKASEQSARMVAMRNATDAAGDLIDEITLAANNARQNRITKEMLEIASGAEALAKG